MWLIVSRSGTVNKQILRSGRVIIASVFLLPAMVFAEPTELDQSAKVALGSSIQPFANADEARLHAGKVWHGGRWLDIEELNESQMTLLLKRYLQERGDGVLDIEGHRRMANWAEEHEMKLQAQAHWYGVLAKSPNDEVARTKLQFERVSGEWLTKDDIRQAEIASKDLLKQTKAWMPKMKKWALSLMASNTKEKLAALDALKNLKDPTAVFALQRTAVQLPDDIALPFVAAIKNVRSKEACAALVNISIDDPSSKCGQSAIAALKDYPKGFYVPDLIDSLSTDVELLHRVFDRPNGERVMRLIQSKEMRDMEHFSVLDKVIHANRNIEVVARFTGMPYYRIEGRSEQNGLANKIADREAQRVVESVRKDVAAMNSAKNLRQNRVEDVLRACSNEGFHSTPENWWAWWDQFNELLRLPGKGYSNLYHQYSYQEDRSNPIYSTNLRFTSYFSCLVRGTMIQTETGIRAIETIRTGDLVLAQDIESGSLSLKPVLNTTLRPPAKTLRFTTKAGTVQATLGHYWWVDGSGWLRSKELAVGMPLHLAKGTAEIEAIEEATEDVETFNLVVADYHTYFVGPERILSNDATELRPTLQAIPGSPELVKVFISK